MSLLCSVVKPVCFSKQMLTKVNWFPPTGEPINLQNELQSRYKSTICFQCLSTSLDASESIWSTTVGGDWTAYILCLDKIKTNASEQEITLVFSRCCQPADCCCADCGELGLERLYWLSLAANQMTRVSTHFSFPKRIKRQFDTWVDGHIKWQKATNSLTVSRRKIKTGFCGCAGESLKYF